MNGVLVLRGYGGGVVTLRLFKWILPRCYVVMKLDEQLKDVIDEADAIVAKSEDVKEIDEYIDDRTYILCADATQGLGYGLFHEGSHATEVGMAAVDEYDNVVHVWRESGYGLVCEETAPDFESSSDSGVIEGKSDALDEAVPSAEKLADLSWMLDRTRCIILQQILAHDSGVLCEPELAARNRDVNQSTLQHNIDILVDRGILTEQTAPEDKGNLPSVFYAVSEHGIELLKQVNLYDGIAVWKQVYSQASTPEKLTKIEEMNRPEPDWYE